MTRGWIANELFRRVDPSGQTIGEYLREEISGPLEADAIIGVRESELDRIAKVSPLGFGFQFLESLKPRFLGRKIVHNCSARGLAKIAAMMSARGRWGERAFLNEEGWQALHAEPVEADMGFCTTNFTKGGVNQFTATDANSGRVERDFNQGREGFYGWMGLGGSIFQWHPEHEIGFGYVPTSLHVLDILNERGKAYQAEVLRCIERLAQ